MTKTRAVDVGALQDDVVAFVRAFGLHRPGETPCGRPVSVSEAHALMELSNAELITQSELSVRLNLEKSTVSRLVGELVERGWIDRERDPGDGRALRVRLTEKGRRAARELADARRAKFQALLERIPESERADVHRALGVLVEALRDSR